MEFNISDLQDAWKFFYLITVINNYSSTSASTIFSIVVVLYLTNSNFSGTCQITNIAKFNSMLIIRVLQYMYKLCYSNCV